MTGIILMKKRNGLKLFSLPEVMRQHHIAISVSR
jgi:hypothetical protein